MRPLRPGGWAAVDETLRVDGYGFVKKAMAMGGPSAEMEFAASLMTQGAVASAHRSRANAAAARGSYLAANLARVLMPIEKSTCPTRRALPTGMPSRRDVSTCYFFTPVPLIENWPPLMSNITFTLSVPSGVMVITASNGLPWKLPANFRTRSVLVLGDVGHLLHFGLHLVGDLGDDLAAFVLQDHVLFERPLRAVEVQRPGAHEAAGVRRRELGRSHEW